MRKLLFYQTNQNGNWFFDTLKNNLPFIDGKHRVLVANVTTHGLARIFERGISGVQEGILRQIAKNKSISFFAKEVSEIRGVELDDGSFVATGIVVGDIVLAIHSIHLTPQLRNLGFGTYEGTGYAVIKTALFHPNVPQPWDEIDGFKIVK